MATLAYPADYVLDLPACWVNARKFETALLRCGDALGAAFSRVVIRFPAGCKLMIDVVIRLLSFCNQIIATTRRLRLEFAGGEAGIMGYLNRMGFFDHLSRETEVLPNRPSYSGALIHRGGNRGLVEIARFSRSSGADSNLVPQLAQAIKRGCASRNDVTEIADASFNIFSELVGNVFEHSRTELDAYAALQTYEAGNQVMVAVSDSGVGLMDTLRPALKAKNDPLCRLGDVDLLVEIFRKGISSLDDDRRGLGLMSSARHAMRFKADLDVRLLRHRVLLKPANDEYRPSTAYSQDNLPLLWGTHIAFSLKLA
jgi:hypothetical protein